MRSLLTGLTAALACLLALPAAAQPYAYVPNYGSHNVSVINTANNTVTATLVLPGGTNPYSVAVTPTGDKVLVGNSGNSTVSVITTATNTVAAAVALPIGCIYGMAVNPAGTRGYAMGGCSGNVVVIDLTTSPVSTLTTISGFNDPRGAVVSPDGSRVYVANYGGQNVGVIDAANHAVSFIAMAGRNPARLALDSSGGNLWVSHDGSPEGVTHIGNPGGVPVVDSPINTGGSCPRGIALSPNGATAYVANNCSNTVSAINTTTSTAGTPVATGTSPVGVSVTPDGSRVFVINAGSNNVSVYTPSLVSLPPTPVAVGVTPYAFGNFIAQPITTADITGTITTSLGVAMSGLTVANSGAPSTSTNSSGVYSFADLANGSYTITPPSLANYIFTPASHNVTLSGTDVTGRNFVGTYDGRPDITDLRSRVVAANLTDTRLRTSLLAPLDAALVWLNGSDPRKVEYACSNLAKFIAVVRQNITYSKLPAATGNPWIVAANDILALSGCPTR